MSEDPEELLRTLVDDIEDLLDVVNVVKGEIDEEAAVPRLNLVQANLRMTKHYVEWILEDILGAEPDTGGRDG